MVEELQEDDEPTIVLQRSRKAAYIVSPEVYERDQAELSRLRRELFLAEVREAEREIAAGETRAYDDVEDLVADLKP